MSVFASDERILIEEIVETTTEDQEPEIFGSETLDESGIAAVALVEVADTQEEDLESEELELHEELKEIKHERDSKLTSRSGKNISGGGGSSSNSSRGASHNNSFGNGASSDNTSSSRVTQRTHMEQEKRIRREIANSNERRRMQSINAGFQSLRTLLPHHEGEKLSKAAILQQTAEYIYQLEQEKTQLLSQNCQLKRLVNQHEGGDVPIKKRKAESQGVVVNLPMHVSESGDEGLGSMSPEPLSVITVSADNHSVVNSTNNNNSSPSISSEVAELRRQLERERQTRLHLEKQMRAIQGQVYSDRFRDNQQVMTYQPHEVIEHTDNVMAQETEEAVAALQVVSVMSIPAVGSTQTVETSDPDPISPPLSPQQPELITDEIKEEERPASPKIVTFAANNQIFTATIEEQTNNEAFSPTTVTYASEFKGNGAQFIAASPTRPFSPVAEPRLPSVLEAAIKAEPKVEVERLPSPASSLEDGTPQSRHYLANTSRQNLETIVEAIRHLEGDHLFSDEPAQDAPLALTNKPIAAATAALTKQRLSQTDVNFFQLHTKQPNQQRPGVIVAKHS